MISGLGWSGVPAHAAKWILHCTDKVCAESTSAVALSLKRIRERHDIDHYHLLQFSRSTARIACELKDELGDWMQYNDMIEAELASPQNLVVT